MNMNMHSKREKVQSRLQRHGKNINIFEIIFDVFFYIDFFLVYLTGRNISGCLLLVQSGKHPENDSEKLLNGKNWSVVWLILISKTIPVAIEDAP